MLSGVITADVMTKSPGNSEVSACSAESVVPCVPGKGFPAPDHQVAIIVTIEMPSPLDLTSPSKPSVSEGLKHACMEWISKGHETGMMVRPSAQRRIAVQEA
jgi:hypothetical protein